MEIGPMQNFLYFIGCDETNEVAIVDPAWDINFIIQEAEKHGYTITKALLTHGHLDHCEGAAEITDKLNIPILISVNEAPYYQPPNCTNLETVRNGQKIPIGHIEVECISTPGHAAGCMCFRYGDILLTGDTLFVNSCGRCDLPGGDAKALYHSLYEVIMKLPDSTIIYPGHKYGPWTSSTLAKQKECNPFLTCKSEEEFLKTRMGY
jgi:glyoxylase-like metal-dependent hydrolase (beta-lactamase superfamily II)